MVEKDVLSPMTKKIGTCITVVPEVVEDEIACRIEAN
jgi:hypothetical protein